MNKNIKNRIKSPTLLALIIVLVLVPGCTDSTKKRYPNEDYVVLKDFNEMQEENPVLVDDGNGRMWLFSLKRQPYPKNTEFISAFHFNGEAWTEINEPTKTPGQYEAHAAACAPGGEPVLAWTVKKKKEWTIHSARLGGNKISDTYQFKNINGRSINPVLIAPDKGRNWIAWENLHKGKFTIYISKYEDGLWSNPIIIDKGENSCFDPAMAESKNGDLYIAYGLTQGYHQNIEVSIIDGRSLEIVKQVPVAVGGGFKDRVNLNTKPALAFDAIDRLWISYENNRNAHRLNDGDNYTGDRYCAIVSYQNGKIVESKSTGRWLFTGKNDHRPTFVKDGKGRLYLATHCGGDFKAKPFWKYRLSALDPQKGWLTPWTILETSQKGELIPPAAGFDGDDNFWLATSIEKITSRNDVEKPEGAIRSRLTQLIVQKIAVPVLSTNYASMDFEETQVVEHLPDDRMISTYSGHPKGSGEQITIDGEVYTLVYGNLHEHSESSSCWPAGTDGTLHDDYRFGMFSENYDFLGITDHGYTMTEVYWRKYTRLAEFYNEDHEFVAIPSMEWTLRSDPKLDSIQFAAGHYNVIFASTGDSRKFIRNEQEIYSVYTPESKNSVQLWELLDEKNINCVTIPHHPADEAHPVDWDVHNKEFTTVVELFQCRGNSEYPGCPREYNLDRHRPTKHKRAYVNYALKEKKYKMGFIASGDHNSMGIGLAALWVKELTREGIIEALKKRRSFATTGDKMIMDFRINGALAGSTVSRTDNLSLNINVKGQRALAKVEVLRNSEVIKVYDIEHDKLEFSKTLVDKHEKINNGVLYYYIRATQKNNEIAWSSPIWVE